MNYMVGLVSVLMLMCFATQSAWAYMGSVAASYGVTSSALLSLQAPSLLAYKSIKKAEASKPFINHMDVYRKSSGAALEDTMHGLYSAGKGGYRNIPLPGHTGIDGLYVRSKGKNGIKLIVAEGKFSGSQLGNPKIGPQMGREWIKANLKKGIDDIGREIKRIERMNVTDGKLSDTSKKRLDILRNDHQYLKSNQTKIIKMIDEGAFNKELVRGRIEDGRLQVEFYGIDENQAENTTRKGNIKDSSLHKKRSLLYSETRDGKGRALQLTDKPGIALDSRTYQKEDRNLYRQMKTARDAEARARSMGNEKEANRFNKEAANFETQRTKMSETRNMFIRSYSKNYGVNIQKKLMKQGVSEVDANKIAGQYESEIKKLIAKGEIKNPKDMIKIAQSPKIIALDLQAEAKVYKVKVETDSATQRVRARLSIAKARAQAYGFRLKEDVHIHGVAKTAHKRIRGSIIRNWHDMRKVGTEMRQGMRYFSVRTTRKGKVTGAKKVGKAAAKGVLRTVIVAAILYDSYEIWNFSHTKHTQRDAYQFYAPRVGAGIVGAAGAYTGFQVAGMGCAASVVLIEFSPICAGVGGVIGGVFGAIAGMFAGDYTGGKAYAWVHEMSDDQRYEYYVWLKDYYLMQGINNG